VDYSISLKFSTQFKHEEL